MNHNLSIQLKAAFLLLIFSLNIVVGFACSIGLDMGFNSIGGHHEEAKTAVHVHANGKKHHHQQAANKTHKREKDDCCNDIAVKISQADKSVPQVVKLLIPAFPIGIIGGYFNITIFPTSKAKVSIKYFVQGHHPPIPDIRIAIQSFQI